MISVAKGMNPWHMGLRWLAVLVFASLAMGWVYASIEVGDSALTFTRFVLVIWLYGIARSIVASVALVQHKRRLRRIPSEMGGKDLGAVVRSWQSDRSPFVGVICSAHEQFIRNIDAVDTETLIDLLEDRLYRAGPQGTFRTASLSLTLGFLGTCFGMLITMNGMSAAAAVAGNDPARLSELLLGAGGPLSGLGGAYLSTLAALACGSVVLRGFGQVQEDGVADLVAEFKELVSVYVKTSLRGKAA